MRTTVVNAGKKRGYQSLVAEAAMALRDGALVVFPTETVYGVAANAANPQAVERLKGVKGRPDQQPFTVHIGHKTDAKRFLGDADPLVRRLVRRGWPGPMTLICDVSDPSQTEIAKVYGKDSLNSVFCDGTVGLRCPDHPIARQLLCEAGVPIIASSANRAGGAPPTDFREAMRDMDTQVEMAIDDGGTGGRVASTIVKIEGHDWRILREGAVDQRSIERMANSTVLMVCTGNSCRSPMAEYLFRHKLAERLGIAVSELERAGYHVMSAGTFAAIGVPASTGTQKELSLRGIDARGHRSQPVTPELVYHADRVFAMTRDHRDMVLETLPGVARRIELLDESAPVPDPIGGGPVAYRECAIQLERAVAARVEEFVHEDRNWE